MMIPDAVHVGLGRRTRWTWTTSNWAARARTDGRLCLNAAAFYTKYKDFQVQIFDSSSVSLAPPLQLANAGGAETKGVELDLQFAATDTLRLDFNAAYIDAEFTDYQGAPCYYADQTGVVPAGSNCFQDLNGNRCRTRASLTGARWAAPLAWCRTFRAGMPLAEAYVLRPAAHPAEAGATSCCANYSRVTRRRCW
jgi:hypothetical protein